MTEVTDPELLKQLNDDPYAISPPTAKGPPQGGTDGYTDFPGPSLSGLGTGVAQGAAGALADIRSHLPGLPFEPEDVRKLKQEGVQRVQNWAAQPSQTTAQGIGKVVGGALPYFAVGGPSSLPALATRWIATRAGAIPGPILHVAGRLMGVSPRILHLIQHGFRTGALHIGGMAPPVAGGIRAGTRAATAVADKSDTKLSADEEKKPPPREEPPSVNRSRKGDLARIREERNGR
jgi:hypothetical protein